MFNKTNLNMIRQDMKDMLSAVEAKHNLQIQIGNMSYSNFEFTCKLTVAASQNGEEANIAKTQWRTHCRQFGFTPDHFELPFESHTGKHFIISGIKPRSTKYPILGKCAEDGQEYKFKASHVLRLLGEDNGV